MDLSNLQPAVGSTSSRRRIGRGPGSGMGGTSTRGHKGAKAAFGLLIARLVSRAVRCRCSAVCLNSGFKNINRVGVQGNQR